MSMTSSIYVRNSTTPEMSPRYHLLQKEISSRYQRTKDMLDKVVFRSGSADRSEASMFYERTKTEPVEDSVRRSIDTEEKPRMSHLKGIPPAEDDTNKHKVTRNVFYGILHSFILI